MGRDVDGTSISVIGVSSRLLLFDTAEVEMTASLLSQLLQGLFQVKIVTVRVKQLTPWGRIFLLLPF